MKCQHIDPNQIYSNQYINLSIGVEKNSNFSKKTFKNIEEVLSE